MTSDPQSSRDRTKLWRAPLALSLAGVALALGLSGCASGTTTSSSTSTTATESTTPSSAEDPLQSYLEAGRPMAEAEFERYSDIYSDFSLEAEGERTMVYRYTFRNQLDPEQAESSMAGLEGTLETLANDVVLPEMRTAGIEDPVVKWVYQNPDGTVIRSFEVPD